MISNFFDALLKQPLFSKEVLEIIAVISAVIYVYLAAKANKWCFLFGLISSVIYVYIATVLKFYFDTAINAYYVFMSIYGWVEWGKTKPSNLQIQSLSKAGFRKLILIGLLLCIGLGLLADYFSDAVLAYPDAFTTIFSFIATYLVVKKYIENWIIWIFVDLIAAGMYFYKELYLTALLFILYTILAIWGFKNWKKKLDHAL